VTFLSQGFDDRLYPFRHLLDEDCPRCGWPEMGVARKNSDLSDTADVRVICRKCGFDEYLVHTQIWWDYRALQNAGYPQLEGDEVDLLMRHVAEALLIPEDPILVEEE